MAIMVENVGRKLDVSKKVNIWGANVHFQFLLLTDAVPSSSPPGLADFLSPLFPPCCNELKSRLALSLTLDIIYFPAFFSHFFKLHFSSLLGGQWRCSAPLQTASVRLWWRQTGPAQLPWPPGREVCLMSAAPRPGHGKGSSWWTCSASGMAAAKRLSWFPEPPPHCFSVLWWGVLGLHSHPEPGHRGNQSAFPLLSQSLEGQGRFVLDGYLSLLSVKHLTCTVFLSEKLHPKMRACGESGQGHQMRHL